MNIPVFDISVLLVELPTETFPLVTKTDCADKLPVEIEAVNVDQYTLPEPFDVKNCPASPGVPPAIIAPLTDKLAVCVTIPENVAPVKSAIFVLVNEIELE